MVFNTALSGLSAASSDLSITGNNIANASTVGFKASRAEFADVYSSSLLGSGANQIGSGVKLANIAQQFDQGTISFTNNSLDLAIDGNGFFMLSDQGTETFTRAGAFGIDDGGFIVATSGARVQGFTANEAGTLSGILGDLQVDSSNQAPQRTALVETLVNLDARSEILSQLGTTLQADGSSVGVARLGQPTSTESVLETLGPPGSFDFGVNSSSTITAGSVITPFDFSVNSGSSVRAASTVSGFNFGVDSSSSISGAGGPVSFNFSDKPSAVSGSADVVGFDYSGANSATFDVNIAGSTSDGVRTVTLNSNLTSAADVAAAINPQLSGIGVQARVDPNNANQVQFFATGASVPSVITVDSYTANGAASTANLQATLSGVTDGSASIPSSFDVTVAGSSADGTATVFLNANINSLPALIADVRDQLSASGFAVDVREDPSNSGRLQFFSTDTGIASNVTVNNFQSTDAGVNAANIANTLRLTDGATNTAPGAGALGVIGSLTRATFDVGIAGGSGPGGNNTATVVLDRNFADNDLNTLISEINNQLNAVGSPGVDVRASEDPDNPGRLRFASTIAGESSTVTVDNFQVSGIAGDEQTSSADISGLLGGIAQGASANDGVNNNVSFQLAVSGSSVPSENQTITITLDKRINTLQDLISDIRDDLVGLGAGVDVREDPNGIGNLQFFASNPGESSTITIDPNGNAVLGNGVSLASVQAAMGGITLGQAGASGASNANVNPFGNSSATGVLGNITAASFDVTVAGSTGNNGTVTVNLDDNIQSLQDLITDIRDDLVATGLAVDVREDPANAGRLQFYATVPGEASTITISNLNTTNIGVTQNDLASTLNLGTGVTVPGVASVNNGYTQQVVDVTAADGTVQTVTTPPGASAAEIASRFSSTNVPGVTATAQTIGRIPAASYNNSSGTLTMSVNGVALSGSNLTQIAASLNEGAPGLATVSAVLDTNGDLVINDAVGNDLVVTLGGGAASDGLQLLGSQGTGVNLNAANNNAGSVGGDIQFTLDEGVTMANAVPAVTNVFGLLDESAFEEFQLNTFDPTNQDTYNAATSTRIFDSLGNPHVMSLFFVKERFTPGVAAEGENRWTAHVQIDGKNVGDPDPNLPPPQNVEPSSSSFAVQFNQDGTINPAGTEPILISNWEPLDSNGQPNGAEGPQNVLAGGALPVTSPAASSNFEIRLGKSTQYGSEFAVSSLDQDGYTTGELSGLNIDDSGVVSARFTNGENQTLGQVAIADFTNVQGLSEIGDTSWVATNDSGEPVVAAPGSGSLGSVTSGALEDSNVDLSEQLVQLIIAQRNFQANARTISTSDEITQTIINL